MVTVRAPDGGAWIVQGVDTGTWVDPGAEIEVSLADGWALVNGAGFTLVAGELPTRSPLEHFWRRSDLGL